MITITPEAAEFIKKNLEDVDKNYLRICVMGGGCSGLQYSIFVTEATGDVSEMDGAELFEISGLRVLIDPISKQYLKGSVIVLDGMGLKITNNPNAKSTCGCGHSFEPGEPAK